jgi:hypothetical protein
MNRDMAFQVVRQCHIGATVVLVGKAGRASRYGSDFESGMDFLMKKEPAGPSARSIVAVNLYFVGIAASILAMVLLVIASLTPLGLVNPFPTPPVQQSKVPWAQTRPIGDPSELNRRPGEAEHQYFKRLAVSVSAAIMHWWPENDPFASRYTRVTFLSDYAMWTMSKFARWGNLQNYEFMSPRPALQRGFGFCSQTSRIVFSVLIDNGFRPLLMNHEHHTVIAVNDTVIDSDYGVFIPHSLSDLQEKLYLIPFYYRNFPGQQPLLQKIFEEGFVPHSETEYLEGILKFERSVQYLKWQIPIGLMVFSALLILASRGLSARADGSRVNERTARGRSVASDTASPFVEQAGVVRMRNS